MRVIVELPDEFLQDLGHPADLPRQMVEALAAQSYRTGRLSRAQVSRLLGMGYWETEKFFTDHDAKRPYGLVDLEADREALDKILGEP